MPGALTAFLLVLIYAGPATLGVYHALLYKRDPRAAMGWIMACIFIPYGGPIAYYLFGINRVRSRARGLKKRFFVVGYEATGRRASVGTGSGDPRRDAGGRITGRAISTGNRITALHNGDSAYPAMLEAIGAARERILLATYIFSNDETGLDFARALGAAVRRGVDVKVLVDGVGEFYSLPRISGVLRKHGVNSARFLPPRLLPPSIYINLRNHRKVLVVDDACAFAGGMNLQDGHVSRPGEPRTISDLHFCLTGPVLDELAGLFYHDWHIATGKAVEWQDCAPAAHEDAIGCRVIPDGPDEEMDALSMTIHAIVSAATRNIDVMTPYFLPDRALTAALIAAAVRGVRVRIVLPGKNNMFYMHWANRNVLAELLQWGVQAWYQPAPFCHTKLLCIDSDYTLIGSANLDARSLRLNFELGIEVFSAALSAEMHEHFERTIAVSEPVEFERLARRSVAIRLRDSGFALFSPYL